MASQTPRSRPGTMGPVPAETSMPSRNVSTGEQSGQQNGAGSGAVTVSEEEWESEKQLVASLAMLQELEAKIHKLRSLVPERLLAPLMPIIRPQQKFGTYKQVPNSPHFLLEQLISTGKEGAAEVEDFKKEWTRPELKPVWDRVEQKMKDSNGEYPQPTGVWEKDYDVILADIDQEERRKVETKEKEIEEKERAEYLSIEGGWRGVIERFRAREVPDVRIVVDTKAGTITVVLLKAGLSISIQQPENTDNGAPDAWRILYKPGRTTKLEEEIMQCLHQRRRQWDLAYLLNMIAAFAYVKQTPCLKCQKMTDAQAQLPTIRKSKPSKDDDGKRVFIFEPFHRGCL
ncbi:hypothetical protein FQN54_002893 [Arachnomyces sp. PD_36]|nr:hypothetical protein FQN54_002893 [Arachnomyces sp. PD_36]